jgi:hypothetical protein
MAAVEVTISGVLYDKLNRTTQQVVLVGEGSLTGLGVGGGPAPGGPPLGIWGPTDPRPTPPISGLPGLPGYEPPLGIWGPTDPRPTPPIYMPPLPPGTSPPEPGDPTTPLPPPAGSAGWPVTSMVPPPYIVINYPGIGPVVVAPPAAGG